MITPQVTTDYLDKFPYISPSDFKVTGEATPGYLYCLTCPTYILKYMPKVRLLFTLRNPIGRAYSEYLNKRVDKTGAPAASPTRDLADGGCTHWSRARPPGLCVDTVMRYLHKRINTKMDKELTPHAPPFARLVDEVAKSMQARSLSHSNSDQHACSRRPTLVCSACRRRAAGRTAPFR